MWARSAAVVVRSCATSKARPRRRSPSLTWESEYTDMYCLFMGAHRGGSCLRLVDCNGGVFGALTAPQGSPNRLSRAFSRPRGFRLPSGHPAQWVRDYM